VIPCIQSIFFFGLATPLIDYLMSSLSLSDLCELNHSVFDRSGTASYHEIFDGYEMESNLAFAFF